MGNVLDGMKRLYYGPIAASQDETCGASAHSAQKSNVEVLSPGDINKITVGTSSGSIFVGGKHNHNPSPTMQPTANNGPLEIGLLQQGLKQFYNLEEEWYHPIEGLNARPSLLKDYYVELQFREFYRNGFKANGTIPIEEVFLSRESERRRPTRILVTGEAGYGKSTLCKKLVHDWVEESEYISQFDIVALIRFRGVAGTIEDAVVQLCNEAMGSKYKQLQVLQCLKQLGSKFLLILDGYDELKENAKKSFESIFEYKNSNDVSFLKLATILMTTRPENKFENESNLLRNPLVGEKIGFNVCQQAFENFFNIDELTDNARISFINKYFKSDPEKAESLINRTEISLTRSPLLLHIMCYIHEQETVPVVNAQKGFWDQYLELIFKRAISRQEEGSLNFTEQGIDPIVLILGEIFFKHLQLNELYIDEEEIKASFLGTADFVMSCGLLQKVFTLKSEDSNMFEAPHTTFMEYLSGKYLNDAFNQAERDQTEINFIRNLFQHNVVIHLQCAIFTSLLSVKLLFQFFSLQFAIEATGPSYAPLIRINTFWSFFSYPREHSIYLLRLCYLGKREGISEFVNYLSIIDPICGGMHRLRKLVELLEKVLPEKFLSEMELYVSHDCSAEFCKAMKLSDARLKYAIVECFHSPHNFQKTYKRSECNVEQICTLLLSKPGVEVHCLISHSLREGQLIELLLKKYEGDHANLELMYPSNETNDKFFQKKGNRRKLKNVTFDRSISFIFWRKFSIALRPGKDTGTIRELVYLI